MTSSSIDEAAAPDAAHTKAREHGWTETTSLDYDGLAAASEPSWASDAQVYEWRGDEGEVGPEDEIVKKNLFRNEDTPRAGKALQALQLNVTLEGPMKISPVRTFEDAGLHPVIRENVGLCGYKDTTAVQAYCIPAVLAGKDVVAVAQTGSGKTAAYLVPILSKLMGKARKLQGPRPNVTAKDYNPALNKVRAEPLVVVVCPTRELAKQIFDEARRLCYRSMLRPTCCYGGVPLQNNIQELGKGCDILIGTPGRLCGLMEKPHVLSMRRVKFTVVDEADEMLHDDWAEALDTIMKGGDSNEDADHAYMMFSATFPREARQLARQYMSDDFVRVRVGRAGSTHANIQQDIIFVEEDAKQQAIYDLLFSKDPALTLIFCNHVTGVERLDDFLFNRGLPTSFMHGKRTQYEREDAMRNFRSGRTPILISTSISGRGIDIANVAHVINYDLPSTQIDSGIDEYIHRIGRTGRIGHIGLATSFYNSRDEALAPALVNVLMETAQAVPDFLAEFQDGTAPVFHDDTDDEGEDYTAAVGADHGEDSGQAPAASDSAWGVEPAQAEVVEQAWGMAPAATTKEVTAAW